MEIDFADPRTGGWEANNPVYRVCFWKQSTGKLPADAPHTDRAMYSARWHEIRGANNVAEVLAWAAENANNRIYVVYVVVDRADERGLVRLYGINPTAHKGEEQLDWPGQVYI